MSDGILSSKDLAMRAQQNARAVRDCVRNGSMIHATTRFADFLDEVAAALGAAHEPRAIPFAGVVQGVNYEALANATNPPEPECVACDKPGEHCSNQHGICSRVGGRPHASTQPPGADLLHWANEVLRVYMPQFNDSRAVDDCLVGLAAAVTAAEHPTATKGGE